MGPAKGIKVLLLIVIVGVLGSAFGLVRTASASQHFVIIADFVVAGSGSAGSGSLTVAAVFSTFPASNGAGAFSGSLGVPSGPASGLFSLTVINPANAPVLHCPNGQVSAAGKVVSGSFLNDQVIIAGCIGSGVSGAFLSGTAELPGNDFSAIGTGTGTAAVIHGTGFSSFVAAGVTSGSGSAGSGTIYTAEADGIASDGSLFGGGAFTGTTTDSLTQQGNTWQLRSAFLQPGCTLTTTGLTASFGSFPNQPVSSTYTLVTCPPTSLGPQTARFVYVVGGETNPIYKGTELPAILSIQVST